MTILSDIPSYGGAHYETPDDLFVARDLEDADGADAYVIEAAEIAAGVIVREKRGYRFYASNARFQSLDGSMFKSPRAAQSAADLLQRATERDLATRRSRQLDGFLRDVPWS